jgi:hypothetical protein
LLVKKLDNTPAMKKFITIVLIAFAAQAFGQANLVTGINIALPVTPDANTANWTSGTSLLTITANAHAVSGHVDAALESAKILVIIKKAGAKVCGLYNSASAPAAGFTSLTKVWSGNNATALVGQTCLLLPGNYEVSVQFFTYSNNKMTAVSDEKTKAFTIPSTTLTYQQPQTTQPINNAQFTATTITQPITLHWTPVLPAPQGAVTYRIKIWQLMTGQTVAQAKSINQPLLTRDVTSLTQTVITNLVYGPCQPPYLCSFVWTVQALNNSGSTLGGNNGTSADATFGVPAGTPPPSGLGCATVSTKAFTTGDEISLSNDFKLKLTAPPTGTNNSLTGTGTVLVKWLGLLNVKFKDIKINGNDKLCSGDVYTNSDPAQQYPTQWAVNVINNTSAGSWTVNKIKQISGSIKVNKLTKPLVSATNQVNSTLAANPINMPLGYFKGGDTTTAIGFTEMIFRPDYAEFEVIASLNTQGIFKDGGFSGTDAVALRGSGIQFTSGGLTGLTGSIKLIQPLIFTYANAGTENLKLTFNIESAGHLGNGVVFGASDFWTYTLDANLELPKEWLVPVDPAKTNVDMNFQASIAQWSDFILQGTLPACIIPNTNGVGLEVGTIAYDHSTIANVSGMVFPAGYVGNNNSMFTGLYLKNFKFTLPDQLRSYADTTKAVQVMAENLIIDKFGISGKVVANNVLTYPIANIGNLGASIDTVKISLANSALTEASMKGKITLPLSSSNTTGSGINYTALFTGSSATTGNVSSLTFALHPDADITSKFLGDGKLHIDQSSSLNLTLSKNSAGKRNIQLAIDLNGNLFYPTGKIIDFGSSIPMDLDLSCDFEHLGMTYNKNAQESFTFNPGHWAFASPQKKLSGFPFTITEVKPKIDPIIPGTEKQYLFKGGVEITAKINIGSENSNIHITGDTKIALTGAIESDKYTPPAGTATLGSVPLLNTQTLLAQSQLAGGNINSVNGAVNSAMTDWGFLTQLKPKYLGVQVKSISIESHMPAVVIKGSVDFYKHDPVYGNGFRGDLTAKFTTLELGIQAGAIFGNTKYIPGNTTGFKYWMVEAQVNLPPPGIIFLTGVAFRGFGAGVYSRMNLTTPAVFNPTTAAASTFGGAVFTPDATVSMGFKAKAIIATTPKEETFNGSVALSAQFNTNGGMNFIQFDGLFNCGAKIGSEATAFANGALSISYNFPQKLFDMNTTLLINKNPISTPAPGIQTKLHIDGLNNKWFFMSGTPTIPNRVNILGVGINSYLMFGNDIEIPQGFMQETRDGFASIGHSLPSFADNATGEQKYQSAKGFAFGIGLNYNNSDSWNVASWKKYYVKIDYNIVAGGEIDASFLQYANCVGLGNGWRAKASMAVYAGATLGYSYKVPLCDPGSGVLVSVDGSAYATAEFPNPTYFAGRFDGDFSLLGYDVPFHKSFSTGSQCVSTVVEPDPAINQNVYTQQNVSDSLNYSLIQSIVTPEGSNVSRTTKFGALLNYPANQAFDVQEQQSSGQIKVRTFKATYTVTLTKDSVSNTATMLTGVAHANLVATGQNGTATNTGSASTNINSGQPSHAYNSTATLVHTTLAAALVTPPLTLVDAGYDDMGAKLYKRAAAGGAMGALNPNPLAGNTSYKFLIKGELQEKVNNVWQPVYHKNTTIPVKQTKQIYFKTNTQPVSSGPVQMSTSSALHHL